MWMRGKEIEFPEPREKKSERRGRRRKRRKQNNNNFPLLIYISLSKYQKQNEQGREDDGEKEEGGKSALAFLFL